MKYKHDNNSCFFRHKNILCDIKLFDTSKSFVLIYMCKISEGNLKRDTLNLQEINHELQDDAKFFVASCEKKYHDQLDKVAKEIVTSAVKMVFLAGPTCAGKTTTAKLLSEDLSKYGYRVLTVSMDDFFYNYDDTPDLPNGKKDLESPRSINADDMTRCFRKLFTEGEADFPKYDFLTGKNIPNVYHLTMSDKTIIILEGLHALNPIFFEKFSFIKCFRIYASALSGFKIGNNVMSTRDFRLLRRTVRDYKKRGYDPLETLDMWKNVVRAEDEFIVPYKDTADAYINTTHANEVAIYRDYFLKLLEEYPTSRAEMPFATLVEKSVSLDKSVLPDNSVLWEFLEK